MSKPMHQAMRNGLLAAKDIVKHAMDELTPKQCQDVARSVQEGASIGVAYVVLGAVSVCAFMDLPNGERFVISRKELK